MEPVRVDLARRHRTYRNLRAASEHGAEQLLAPGGCQLLGVVEERERPHAMIAQALVVEENARDEKRPRQRAAAGLVGAGDEPRA
jgi:hypothetical protein